MIDQLKSIAIFVAVVDAKSFRSAAKKLSLSPSVVSHHVSTLEQQIGAPLLYRSTRALSLTREGEQLYGTGRSMTNLAREGLDLFSKRATARLTELRIAIPVTFSAHPYFSKIAAFSKMHKGIRINLISSDKPKSLLGDGIDVAIRMGHFKDSELKAKRICEEHAIAVAAPSYISQKKKPRQPEDLADWDFISFSPVPDMIEAPTSKSKTERVWGETAIITDSVETMRQLAIAGVGVAIIPRHTIKSDLAEGRLKKLLPGSSDKELPVYIVWPRNAGLSKATRAFIDFLSASSKL